MFFYFQAAPKGTSAALRSPFVTAAYQKYASFLRVLRALHLHTFEQPVQEGFFSTLLEKETLK
jgi:hypothetical protein